MAFGFAERASHCRVVQRLLGDFAGQLRRCRPIQRAERDRRQQTVGFETTEQPSERRIVLLLLGAQRADNEAAGIRRRAQEILQPFDRVRVRPLKVVEDEDERSRRMERVCQRFEEAQALPAFELPSRSWNLGARRDDLRMKPYDVAQ